MEFGNKSALRIVIIALTSLVLFNYPILSIFNKGNYQFGFPTIFLYVIIAWLVLIILIANSVSKSSKENDQR